MLPLLAIQNPEKGLEFQLLTQGIVVFTAGFCRELQRFRLAGLMFLKTSW